MSFWDSDFGSVLRQIGYNATGGIIGEQGKTVTVGDILAAGAYIYGSTPQGQKVISDAAGSYVGATATDNKYWIMVVAILGFLVVILALKKK
ncbi:hypothetical protein CKK33_11490 [Mucilaginibacter sp. MD40]|uniref:hypothetical protein n=1 Tax=Mucilaginibacter sp. MD40 TaxID=2029590 RepID=UPI000BACC024|nr:hypothetical protein [Mucilaginibacter sp. MD40]PAW94084.1 hypothetical protein CKK33_11490 [Mucilaginibacter sp. MD40]